MRRSSWLLAIASEILVALSFPGFELDPLIWFSLIPLFFALEGTNYKQGFWLSALAGLGFFGILLYWVLVLWEWVGFLIVPGYVLLIAYLSLYWGAFGAIYSFFQRRLSPLWLALIVPSLWVVLEFIRAQTRFGFPWGDLGYALYKQTALIQIASITGVWGLSFVIVLVNYLLFRALKARRLVYLAAAVAIFLFMLGFGLYAMRPKTLQSQNAPEIKIAIIQPNISQRARFDRQKIEEHLQLYRRLLQQIEGEAINLVILPESILPGYILQQPELLSPFAEFAQKNEAYLLLGTLDTEAQNAYNATALLSPQGQIVDRYHKVQLVPFGEYVLFRDVLTKVGLEGLIREALPGDFSFGRGFKVINSDLGKIATPICFESIFPAISRKFVQKGAQLLITVTNDAWFKRTKALPQHFTKGVFRAVENRRFFVQAANTGISGVISPHGKIIVRSSIEKEQILYAEVALSDDKTIYARFGDWLVYLAAFFLSTALAYAKLQRPKIF